MFVDMVLEDVTECQTLPSGERVKTKLQTTLLNGNNICIVRLIPPLRLTISQSIAIARKRWARAITAIDILTSPVACMKQKYNIDCTTDVTGAQNTIDSQRE